MGLYKYWNPLQYSLVESSHTRNWILILLGITIPNSKFWAWICIQPTIDVKSQYKFYYFLILDYTSPCPELRLLWSPSKYNYIIWIQSKNSSFEKDLITLWMDSFQNFWCVYRQEYISDTLVGHGGGVSG